MPDVEIRPFSIEDAEAIWRLLHQPGVLETTPTLPSLRIEQRRRADEELGEDDHVLVAVRHGEVAGVASLHVGTGARRHAATLALAVASPHREAGVGDALLRALLELADGWLGLRRVEAAILDGDDAARRLCERHGFRPEGLRRQAIACAGELRDELGLARVRQPMPATADAGAAGRQAGMGSSASSP